MFEKSTIAVSTPEKRVLILVNRSPVETSLDQGFQVVPVGSPDFSRGFSKGFRMINQLLIRLIADRRSQPPIFCEEGIVSY